PNDLHDHFLITVGAVPVQRVRRMQHVAAWLHWYGLGGVKAASRPRVPRAFEDRDVAIVRMPVRSVHDVRRKPDTLLVDAVPGRITGQRRNLRAVTVGNVLPHDLVGSEAHESGIALAR